MDIGERQGEKQARPCIVAIDVWGTGLTEKHQTKAIGASSAKLSYPVSSAKVDSAPFFFILTTEARGAWVESCRCFVYRSKEIPLTAFIKRGKA